MKLLTDEFEDVLVNVIGYGLLIIVVALIIGVIGGIEQGLLWR